MAVMRQPMSIFPRLCHKPTQYLSGSYSRLQMLISYVRLHTSRTAGYALTHGTRVRGRVSHELSVCGEGGVRLFSRATSVHASSKASTGVLRKEKSPQIDHTKEHCNIGTIGHVDHGKTTLTAALTKVMAEDGLSKFIKYDEIDRAPEEKARGITINACHVQYSSKRRHYAHTDCPGHIDYIKNMISGTSQMECAILVVAATDGTMPQTREHLLLARQIGVKHVVVYINKVDLVDCEMVELVQLEVCELLDEMGYNSAQVPMVCGSALCALQDRSPEIGSKSIKQLVAAIDDNVPTPERKTSGPLLMPIETAFTAHGRGTVAIGTLQQGILAKGDPIDLVGLGHHIKTAASDLQVFQKAVPSVQAGDNVGVLLKGVRIDIMRRGMFLAAPNSVTATDQFEARIYVRTRAEGGRALPIRTRHLHMMHVDTWSLASCVLLSMGVDMLMPGDTAATTVLLRLPMVVHEGQQFLIRENDVTSITGIITKKLPHTELQISGFNYVPPAQMKIESNARTVIAKRAQRKKQKAAK